MKKIEKISIKNFVHPENEYFDPKIFSIKLDLRKIHTNMILGNLKKIHVHSSNKFNVITKFCCNTLFIEKTTILILM